MNFIKIVSEECIYVVHRNDNEIVKAEVLENIFIKENLFYKKYSECKECNIRRGVKRYYDNKDKISNQQKKYYEKNRDKLLQKQNDYRNKTNTDFKDLVRSYVELQKKLKALEENLSINDTEKH